VSCSARERRVHRRHRAKIGPLSSWPTEARSSWMKSAISRRHCSPNAPCPAGAGVSSAWATLDHHVKRSAGGGNEPRSDGDGDAWRIPHRPLLPSECVSDLLPPLRARSEDIPALVTHFVEIFARRMGKRIDTFLRARCLRSTGTTGRGISRAAEPDRTCRDPFKRWRAPQSVAGGGPFRAHIAPACNDSEGFRTHADSPHA